MPLPAADPTHWCPSTAGLRWAPEPREKSTRRGLRRIDWERAASGPHRRKFDRRGRELWARQPPPARSNLRPTSPLERSKDLAHPPQAHIRPKLEPAVPPGNQRAAAIVLNGQCVGELPRVSGPGRGPAVAGIAALASRLRSQVQGHKTLAGSTESV
jgi:hypothetical protein